MPVCTPPFFAEESRIAVGGPSPIDDEAAWSSASTEDCMEASNSKGIISTTVSRCSGTAPWAMVTRSPSTRGIVLHEGSPLLQASPRPMSLLSKCIATGLLAAQPMSMNNWRGHMHWVSLMINWWVRFLSYWLSSQMYFPSLLSLVIHEYISGSQLDSHISQLREKGRQNKCQCQKTKTSVECKHAYTVNFLLIRVHIPLSADLPTKTLLTQVYVAS